MNHLMRRPERGISENEARQLLEESEYGILSTCGADGQPYGLPLSYCVIDNAIYFHCAQAGHKIENLAADSRVSFCVVGKTEVLPESFSTRYESVIVFGRAVEVLDAEKQQALEGLLRKYSAPFLTEGRAYVAAKWEKTKVICIRIDKISGKARRI